MIALVIPCYNEEKRLNVTEFSQHARAELQFFFVDDGSTDGTAKLIQELTQKNPFAHLVRMPKNSGKAAAVQKGILEVSKKINLSAADWVGFWDADLATPLSEIPKMIAYSKSYEEVDAIWASRIYRLGSEIQRSALRHYLGRCFATLIGTLLKVKCYDSQCGAKLFRPHLLSVAFTEAFISNWIFDVEILLRLHQFHLIEYPVTVWKDVPGSKVKIFKEVLRVFRDILRIRKKYESIILTDSKAS